jgi:hypothetical protein
MVKTPSSSGTGPGLRQALRTTWKQTALGVDIVPQDESRTETKNTNIQLAMSPEVSFGKELKSAANHSPS